MMRYVLQRYYKYNITNPYEISNKIPNNIDYVLCVIYMCISLFNAISGIGTMHLFTETEVIDFSVVKTLLLIIVNMVVLFRLNLRLYIKRNQAKEKALKAIFYDDINNVTKILTDPLDKRIQLIKYVYLIDFVIIVMNICYKSTIETSLSTIVILPIVITFWNNIIDIAEHKYSAEAKVMYATSEDEFINSFKRKEE